MPDPVPVVIDTNNVDRVHAVDTTCALADMIVLVFGSFGVGDLQQLARKPHCVDVLRKIKDHGTSDEEAALFVMNYKGHCRLDRIIEDPVDIKLLVFALKYPNSMLVSCDRRLLMLAADLSQKRTCFKAALHKVHVDMGGLFDDPSYTTAEMFDRAGKDPFFHYTCDTRCLSCDPEGECDTRRSPPAMGAPVLSGRLEAFDAQSRPKGWA